MLSNDETLISLADVPAILPKRRGGRKVSISCVYRWVQSGLRGHKLMAISVGGTKCTHRRWLTEFFIAISGNDPGASPIEAQPAPVPSDDRAAAIQAAEQRLQEAGC